MPTITLPPKKHLVRPNNFVLDPGHPLNKGCIFAGLGRLAGGYRYWDSSTRQTNGIGVGLDNSDYRPKFGRTVVTLNGSNQYLNMGFWPPAAGLTYTTVTCWFRTSSTSVMALFGQLNITSSERFLRCMVNADPTTGDESVGRLQMYVRASGGKNLIFGVNTDTGITDGEWHHLAVRWNKEQSIGAIWIDGKPQTIQYIAQLFGFSFVEATRDMYLGGANYGSLNIPFSGDLADLLWWQRELSPADIAMLSFADPMYDGWIRPWPTVKYFSFGGGPVTPDVDPDNAVQAQVASSPTITPIANAVPDNAVQDQIASSPTITPIAPVVDITPNNAVQSQVATSPVITPVAADTVQADNAVQSQAATSPTVTGITTLATDQAIQAQVASQPLIQYVAPGGVTVNDADQAQAATSPRICTVFPSGLVLTDGSGLVLADDSGLVINWCGQEVHNAYQEQVATSPTIIPVVSGETDYWHPVRGAQNQLTSVRGDAASYYTPVMGDA